jgi:hypothetical protein
MHWSEKVKRLVDEAGWSYRRVEQLAGWKENTLKAAISKKSDLRLDRAMSLARTLGVQADWLYDPARDWQEHARSMPYHLDLKSFLLTMNEALLALVTTTTIGERERLQLAHDLQRLGKLVLQVPCFETKDGNEYLEALNAAVRCAEAPDDDRRVRTKQSLMAKVEKAANRPDPTPSRDAPGWRSIPPSSQVVTKYAIEVDDQQPAE